ncbi:glycosyltransferase family 4 protein [uncultured Duncaniella sp.]|uniref:glycosyltransferase family 4 protein n=1 Tax=uncultured Duncaniella sp. TaxID=2768039 RepID=UPI0025AA1A0D|nr:glycosyltransferase family 4 protein [uncultured Duncaniella sp.]
MKIVFIGGRDIHIIGGIENYMLNLSTQLVKMGHEPIVFCESDSNYEEYVNGFKVIHLKGLKSNLICKPWVGLKATLYTIRKLKNVDLIHYNAWPPSLWSPIASLFGIKSLMQGHGLEWQRSKYSPFQQRIMKFMELVTAYLNRNLIMCSEDQCRYFKKQYKRNATAIPTAITLPDENKTINSDILTKYSLQPKKYFLFLARLVQDKNPDYLIKAFNKIEANGYKLVIAGNNISDIEYVQMLKKIGSTNPNVIFTDAVYGDDKECLLRNAFTFCIPSTIEGLSISLLEAMSYQLPVIASDIPSNREVLENDKAIWVRAENIEDLVIAFSKAINSPDKIAQNARYNYNKIRKNYTWQRITEKYIAHISTLCTK